MCRLKIRRKQIRRRMSGPIPTRAEWRWRTRAERVTPEERAEVFHAAVEMCVLAVLNLDATIDGLVLKDRVLAALRALNG